MFVSKQELLWVRVEDALPPPDEIVLLNQHGDEKFFHVGWLSVEKMDGEKQIHFRLESGVQWELDKIQAWAHVSPPLSFENLKYSGGAPF